MPAFDFKSVSQTVEAMETQKANHHGRMSAESKKETAAPMFI
jgi:hypothetical protein